MRLTMLTPNHVSVRQEAMPRQTSTAADTSSSAPTEPTATKPPAVEHSTKEAIRAESIVSAVPEQESRDPASVALFVPDSATAKIAPSFSHFLPFVSFALVGGFSVWRAVDTQSFCFLVTLGLVYLHVLVLYVSMFLKSEIASFSFDTESGTAWFQQHSSFRTKSRRIPCHEIRYFRQCRRVRVEISKSSWSYTPHTEYGIEVVTLGASACYGFQSNILSRQPRVAYLNRMLLSKSAQGQPPHSIFGGGDLHQAIHVRLDLDTRLLPSLPSDSKWRIYQEDGGDLKFEKAWSVYWWWLVQHLFAIVACYSIVFFSVGTAKNSTKALESLQKCKVIIVPAVVSVLFILVFVSFALFKTKWGLGRDLVRRGRYCPLSCFLSSQEWETMEIASVELFRKEIMLASELEWRKTSGTESEGGQRLGIAFLSEAGSRVCCIDSLTEGEALHMAHLIRLEHSDWFQVG